MKVGAVPENLLEYLLDCFGVIPIPMIDTFQAMVRARAIMVGVKLDLFEALKDQSATAADVAARIGAAPHATEKLLNALVGSGYLHWSDGRYQLAAVARRWLLNFTAAV